MCSRCPSRWQRSIACSSTAARNEKREKGKSQVQVSFESQRSMKGATRGLRFHQGSSSTTLEASTRLSATPVGGERMEKKADFFQRSAYVAVPATREPHTSGFERDQEHGNLGIVGEVFDSIVSSSRSHRTGDSNELESTELQTTSNKVTA